MPHLVFESFSLQKKYFAKTLDTVTSLYDEHDNYGLFFFRIGVITSIHKLFGTTPALRTI